MLEASSSFSQLSGDPGTSKFVIMTTVPPWKPVPDRLLYEQVAGHLAARMDAGELEPGRRLPPERDLTEEYHVAYHTIRNAMRVLREQGRIVTIQGRGTFVRRAEEKGP
jgi:GntR family transcriptional regulator